MAPRGALITGALATALLLIPASSASASFHVMKVREVGAGSAPESGFVELQMFSAGQTEVNGREVDVYDATGVSESFPIPTIVSFGDNQRTILLGDTAAAGDPDFDVPDMDIEDILAGGAVCFPDASPPDCVEWGTGTDATLPDPQTSNAPALAADMSLTRSIAPNCATLLEGGDDTDGGADFSLATPTPRNNSVAPTETPCTPPPPPGGGGSTTPVTPTPAAPKKRKCKKPKKRSVGASAKQCKKKKKK